jgi:DnaJ-class molecular chaperone
MNEPGSCPECGGKGWRELRCIDSEGERMCSLCNGRGLSADGAPCTGCRGTGRAEVRTVEQAKCWNCNGTGRYPVPESL